MTTRTSARPARVAAVRSKIEPEWEHVLSQMAEQALAFVSLALDLKEGERRLWLAIEDEVAGEGQHNKLSDEELGVGMAVRYGMAHMQKVDQAWEAVDDLYIRGAADGSMRTVEQKVTQLRAVLRFDLAGVAESLVLDEAPNVGRAQGGSADVSA